MTHDIVQHLRAFSFQNDLSRTSGPLSDISSMANLPSVDVTSVQLPKNSRICLMNIHIFEAGLEAAELATAAIAQRFCTCNVEVSVLLIKLVSQHILFRYEAVICYYVGTQTTAAYCKGLDMESC